MSPPVNVFDRVVSASSRLGLSRLESFAKSSSHALISNFSEGNFEFHVTEKIAASGLLLICSRWSSAMTIMIASHYWKITDHFWREVWLYGVLRDEHDWKRLLLLVEITCIVSCYKYHPSGMQYTLFKTTFMIICRRAHELIGAVMMVASLFDAVA